MIRIQSDFSPHKVFFTSDTHFFHDNIIEHAKRPFKIIDEMNETLINNWNKTVPKDGVVFHLGDFCWRDEAIWNEILDQLKGHIHLVLGNHDLQFINRPVMKRFADVCLEKCVSIDGQIILLNHYPLLSFGGRYTKCWQLFGHIHSSPSGSNIITPDRMAMLLPIQYDVGVDNNGFAPVPFEKIRQVVKKQIEMASLSSR